MRFAPRRPRNGEAVFQHSEARDLPAGDVQYEGEGRLHRLARTLHSRCEFTDDHRPSVICQNIVNLEAEWLEQVADIMEQVSRGTASDLPSDPRQRTDISRDLKVESGAEQRSNFVVVGTRAHAGEEFSCNAGGSSRLMIVFLYQWVREALQ